MQNKYIDHLTVDEYKFLQSQLLKRTKEERREIEENGKDSTKEYAQLRFMELKIKSIIKKYEKNNNKTIDTKKYAWYNKYVR